MFGIRPFIKKKKTNKQYQRDKKLLPTYLITVDKTTTTVSMKKSSFQHKNKRYAETTLKPDFSML